MGLTAIIAILCLITTDCLGLLNTQPFQEKRMRLREAVGAGDEHNGPLPEILFLVVLGQALAQISGLADIELLGGPVFALTEQEIDRNLATFRHRDEVWKEFSGDFDSLDDARGDFSHTNSLRVACRQKYLDGFRHSRYAVRHDSLYLLPQRLTTSL